jgi:hypothetical protein
MRDVVTGFYVSVLQRLIAEGAVSISDSVLVVCGGPLDDVVMRRVGFTDYTVTGFDVTETNQQQDAEKPDL